MQPMLVDLEPALLASPFPQCTPAPGNQTGSNGEEKAEVAVSTEEARPQTQNRSFYYVTKRLFDLTLVLLTLGLIWPLLGLIALAIVLESPGAVLVGQPRIGIRRQQIHGASAWHPVRFMAYQFRTVGPDQRLTRVGTFLRQSSLYALPQMWNILCGDISLVGPQPARPSDVASYLPWHRRRLESPQGMTGLWQLRECSHLGFQDMVQLDIAYIETQSFWLDVQILFKTLLAALRQRN